MEMYLEERKKRFEKAIEYPNTKVTKK